MRPFELQRALPIAGLMMALGCQSDHLLDPVDSRPGHPGLEAMAVRLEVNVARGTVRVLPSAGATRDSGGPSLSILGSNEVVVATSNLIRSAPVNGKVTVTFDAALTNRLTSASLVPSTFPTGSGLVLFPFQVTQAIGGNATQVIASSDWNGDGTPGSGTPRNFFNDFGCPSANATADCFRWEQYPAPLGPGETTTAQKVGFTLPKAISSFQVLLVLAADISNDLPAVAAIAVTPPSYVMNDGFPANFAAVAYDDQNHPLPWARLTWTSADITALEFQYGGALVGTISGPSQIVHGRKVGQTSFTVSSGGVSVVVPVDIQVNTVALVQLYTPDSSITAGDQIQGDVRVKDHSGGIIPGFQPTWSTTDPNVITVDQNGLITAVGPGTADVVATAGLQSASVTILVDRLIAGDIAGTMRDLGGQPVKGANVRATGILGAFNTTTANDGSYLFHNLPIGGQGLYIVDWSPPGCVPGVQNRIVLLVGGVVTVDIDVDCPPSVSGVVTTVQGTLPAGLTVELKPNGGGSNRIGTVQADGSYAISGFPAGGYLIFVNHLPSNCTTSAAQSITLTQQNYVKDWTLDCPSMLLGVVTDLGSGGIAGATVEARGQANGQLFSTTSDAAGDYRLNLPPDQYAVAFSKPGSCVNSNTYNVTVPAGQAVPFRGILDCPWRIQGKVVALGGLPLPLTVFLGPLSSPLEHAAVLGDGTYVIDEFPNPNGSSGTLPLNLLGVPTRCAVTGGPSNVTVFQQMQLTVADFTLDCRPPSIEVLVTDGGTNGNPQPLIGMGVTLVGPSGAGNSQTGTTGQNGVLFQTAEAGSNLISVGQGTHGCLGNSAVVTLQPGSQNSIVVPVSCSTTGALEGTLKTMLGNPLPNVNIVVGTYSLVTDQQGHWGVAGLPGGLLFINVLGPMPSGCTAPGAFQAAVIPAFTITANATAICNGF